MISSGLQPVAFDALSGWQNDDHSAAFVAFCRSARRMVETPYKTRALGVDADHLRRVAERALIAKNERSFDAKAFFETNFIPHRVASHIDGKAGFLTGYYEPVVHASRERTDDFPVPLLRQPPELVEIPETKDHPDLPDGFRFARKTETGVEQFFDRGDIQSGALDGRDLELVWVANAVDAFFVHVQGSARMAFADGSQMRVTYAAKSGHPYTSLGKLLCERLSVPPSDMTADRLKDWMYSNPTELPSLLAKNRSYIFFKEVTGLEAEDGPIAAAKVPLIAGRSLAVDRTLHTFGSPVWISTKTPLPEETKVTRCLMIAHDTGSAIVGAARGDIYIGSGDQAGNIAGKVQHETEFTVFVPGGDK